MLNFSKQQLLSFIVIILFSQSLYAARNDIKHKNFDLRLSIEEQSWLQQHPLIRVDPDPQFPPFEFRVKSGSYRGISIDYLELISQRTGLNFEYVDSKNWSRILQAFRQGKIELLSAIARTPQRETIMEFTQPHIVVPGVVITSKDYTSLQQLSGHRVAVVMDRVWDELFSNRNVDFNLVRVKTLKDGIELASMGAVDAMVTDLASISYFLKKESMFNLHIVKYLEQNLELGYAVHKDQLILKSILQKGINSISRTDRVEIQKKWVTTQSMSLWENKNIWTGFIILCAIVLICLAVIISWNISLRKRVEKRTKELQDTQRQLIQAEKMDSIGRLATGIAHEVKNPLAIVQMGIEYLADEIKLNKNNREVLNDINNAIERADHIIDSFLDYTTEEKLSLEEASINEVINQSIEFLKPELEQHQIDYKLNLQQNLNKSLLDRYKLQQVFINLVMNSITAMKDQAGKKLIVETRKTCLEKKDIRALLSAEDFKPGDEVVIVRISDTGCGIDATQADKLFEPFFTTRPVGEGTGLSLPVSLKIMQMHQGAMGIQNQQKCGTVVTLLFRFDSKGEEK